MPVIDWSRWLRRLAHRVVRTRTGYRVRSTRSRTSLMVQALEERLAQAVVEPTFRGGLTDASADITGDGIPDLVGAPGSNVAPRVIVYSGADGTAFQSFYSHEPEFLGGVFVAVGDVTGDGKPEVVVGSGVGGGPRVTVMNPITGEQLSSFFAYAPDFRGGVRVAVADLDGDGVAEIITAPGDGGGPHIRIFDGTGNNLGRDFLAYDGNFRGGVAVAAGDVDGDGDAEIITTPGVGGSAHVKVFDGPSGAVIESYLASALGARGGAWVAAADVDGNGLADVVVGAGVGENPGVQVFAGHGTRFAAWDVYEPTFLGGVRVAAIDLDGDAFADVVTVPGNGGGPRITIWDGWSFTQEQCVYAVTNGSPLGFGLAAPPPRTPLFDGRTLLAPGTPGSTVATAVDLLRRFTTNPGEIGLYRVDDAAGTVDGLAPGDARYPAAALAVDRRLPLFTPETGPGNSVAFELVAGQRYAVYTI